jgi:hypothetical protein
MARKRPAELKRAVAEGRDPLKDREEKRTAPTVDDLIDRYVNEALPLLKARAPRPRTGRCSATISRRRSAS